MQLICEFENRDKSAVNYLSNAFRGQAVDQVCDFDASNDIADRVLSFHKSLPAYSPTPTYSMQGLAHELGLGSLRIKDESQRFNLNAFKVLGASYAVATLLYERLALKGHGPNFDTIRALQDHYRHLTLVTATDGNHGRAVAWAAQKFGCAAQVFMPAGTLEVRAQAIRNFGAEAQITSMNYDDTVQLAANTAEQIDGILVQDTAWHGYTDIPKRIQQGYFSLLSESMDDANPHDWPTHVFVQAGVGSLPAALVERLYAIHCASNGTLEMPEFIVVEANQADCLLQSIATEDGHSISIPGHLNTIMAGLACGTPSSVALRSLRRHAAGFLSCSDEVTKLGMRVLDRPPSGDPRITSGESGAVTLGAVYELLSNPRNANIVESLGLNSNSHVLLFSTEGDTAPELYRAIVDRARS